MQRLRRALPCVALGFPARHLKEPIHPHTGQCSSRGPSEAFHTQAFPSGRHLISACPSGAPRPQGPGSLRNVLRGGELPGEGAGVTALLPPCPELLPD